MLITHGASSTGSNVEDVFINQLQKHPDFSLERLIQEFTEDLRGERSDTVINRRHDRHWRRADALDRSGRPVCCRLPSTPEVLAQVKQSYCARHCAGEAKEKCQEGIEQILQAVSAGAAEISWDTIQKCLPDANPDGVSACVQHNGEFSWLTEQILCKHFAMKGCKVEMGKPAPMEDPEHCLVSKPEDYLRSMGLGLTYKAYQERAETK